MSFSQAEIIAIQQYKNSEYQNFDTQLRLYTRVIKILIEHIRQQKTVHEANEHDLLFGVSLLANIFVRELAFNGILRVNAEMDYDHWFDYCLERAFFLFENHIKFMPNRNLARNLETMIFSHPPVVPIIYRNILTEELKQIFRE